MFSPAILYEHSYIDLYVFITILCELLCRQIQKCSSQAPLKTLCQPLWSCPFFWRSCHLPPNFITHRKHVTLHSAVRMRSSEPFIVVPDISLRLHIILVAAYFFVCFHSYRHHARFPNDFYTPCKYIWRHGADHFFVRVISSQHRSDHIRLPREPEKCRITQDILCPKKRLECSTTWCHARERHFARRRRDK